MLQDVRSFRSERCFACGNKVLPILSCASFFALRAKNEAQKEDRVPLIPDLRKAAERENIDLRGALLRQQAAIDHQHMPSDIARVVGGQKHCRAGQLLDLANPAQWNRLAARTLEVGVHTLAVDRARYQP